MSERKEVKDFLEAYHDWCALGSPEMIPVKVGHGPFSKSLSLRSNYRLFYLYNPKYTEFALEIKE